MSQLYFLDTNAFSYMIRGVESYVQGIDDLPRGSIFIPEPVRDEVENGLEHPKCPFSDEHKAYVRGELKKWSLAPFNGHAEKIHGEVAADLKFRKRSIGESDEKIAATAMSAGAILITDDMKDMGRVRGLQMKTFSPEMMPKFEGIQKAHREAEPKISANFKSYQEQEISKGQYFEVQRKVVRALDAAIDKAINLGRKSQQKEQPIEDAKKKEESQRLAAEILKKKAMALEAIRSKSKSHDRELGY